MCIRDRYNIVGISLSLQSSSLKCPCIPELHQFFFQLPTSPVPPLPAIVSPLPAIVSHTDTSRESCILGNGGNRGLTTPSLCIAVIIIHVTCMLWRLLYAIEVSVGKQAVSLWEGFLTLASIRYSLHGNQPRGKQCSLFKAVYNISAGLSALSPDRVLKTGIQRVN